MRGVRVRMTRSAQSGTVLIHRLGSSAQPLTPTRTCSFSLPDLVALSGSVLHHESAPETVRDVLMVQLQIRIKRTNEVYKKKKKHNIQF